MILKAEGANDLPEDSIEQYAKFVMIKLYAHIYELSVNEHMREKVVRDGENIVLLVFVLGGS